MKTSHKLLALATVPVALLALWLSGMFSGSGGAIEATAGPYRLELRFDPDPPRVGTNRVTITVRDADGRAVEGAEVHGGATMHAMATMAEMRSRSTATARGDGLYELSFDLSMAGPWPLSIEIHGQDGTSGRLEVDYSTGIPVRIAGTSAASAPAVDDVSHYSCSMHPSVRSATPGTCPICSMDLVPVTREEIRTGVIRVDEARRQTIGVRTAPVGRREVTHRIRAAGRVTWDETRLTDVTLRNHGWVGELFADSTGARVEAGKPLLTVYSPELLSAQQELLEALRRSGGRPSPLVDNTRRRLRLWNLTDAQISRLSESGKPWEHVPILSPATGTVIAKHVVAGSAVDPGMALYRIADPSVVWVEADVYEADLELLREGLGVRVELTFLPGKAFDATIAYVYPWLDPATRTGKIRLELPNPQGELRAEMYASVEIEIPLGEQLVIPDQAVLRAGTTDVVFLDLGEGRLQPRRIRIGRKTAHGYVVLDGLAEGDVVVTSGNFLIAAESRLKAGIQQW